MNVIVVYIIFCCLVIFRCVNVFMMILGILMFVVIFLFSGVFSGWDIFLNKNLWVKFCNVWLDNGFDGFFLGVIKLRGSWDSYVVFLNYGKLDIMDEIMIIVWVKFKSVGLIFYYKF